MSGWYRHLAVAPITHLYYHALRQLIRNIPKQHYCLVRCCHCGILFITAPSNRGRKDIRCFFGCREEHTRGESNKRSKQYYSTPEGKMKKRAINQKRKKICLKEKDQLPEPKMLKKEIFDYSRFILSTISPEPITEEEISAFLLEVVKKMRQQGLDFYQLLSKIPDT